MGKFVVDQKARRLALGVQRVGGHQPAFN